MYDYGYEEDNYVETPQLPIKNNNRQDSPESASRISNASRASIRQTNKATTSKAKTPANLKVDTKSSIAADTRKFSITKQNVDFSKTQ